MARLDRFVRAIEARYAPEADFDAALAHERAISPCLGGTTVFDARRKARTTGVRQPGLFDA